MHSSTTEKEKLTLTSQTLKKPALFIRKIAHAPPGALSKLVNSLDGVEKLQELTYKTDLHPADMAVVYFQSEEAALKALVHSYSYSYSYSSIHLYIPIFIYIFSFNV